MRPTPDPGGGAAPLAVDLPDMRGYAALLDDIGRDLGAIESLAGSFCTDADFGRIVEDVTADYATLLPQLHELLAENERVMAQYAVAVDRTLRDFETTDDGVAARFGGDGITGGSGTARFPRTAPGGGTPHAEEGDLPEVSFGFLLDKLCWALEKVCGFDLRAEVTDWIAGDTVGLSTQASCWEIVAGRIGTTADNLRSGGIRVSHTWQGHAAGVHQASMVMWDHALADQETGFHDLADALREMAEEAVNTAQLVVDTVRLAVDLVASAWSLQYIPVYGQVKFAKKVWHAYKRVNKAVAYLKMLRSFLRFVKDLIVVLIDSLTPAMLPPRPTGV